MVEIILKYIPSSCCFDKVQCNMYSIIFKFRISLDLELLIQNDLKLVLQIVYKIL